MAEMYDDDYDLPPKVQQVYDEAYNQQTHHVDQLPATTDDHQLHNTTDININNNNNPDLWRDIVLWKRKQLNVVLLSMATVAWTAMEIYQYKFITILCYVIMAIFTTLFLWGNIHRLLKREAPDLRVMGISEQVVMELATSIRQTTEKAVRLMFHVSVEREWFIFAGAVASLYVLSLVAGCVDLLTLCYIGLVGSMTIPVVYMKNRHRIKPYGEKTKINLHRSYKAMEGRLRTIKDKMAAGKQNVVKEKKME